MSTTRTTIDDLEGWLVAGGRWRLDNISNEHVVVDTCTCTGEPMERVESDDPAVIGYLRIGHPELD